MTIPIAFYAPLKPPDHPSPSGDRTMARLLLRALTEAGFAPRLASRIRTLDPRGSADRQHEIGETSRREAEALVATCGALPPSQRPRFWFTYHLYYKAPDLIGPAVARGLGVPYVVAEASRAGKRAGGRWDAFHRAAEVAIDAARIVFVMTGADRESLERHRPVGQSLVDLAPFLDASALGAPRGHGAAASGRRLLTVAMMRSGDKLASYRLLAEALTLLGNRTWSLDVVGDGPAHAEVAASFAGFGERVRLHGQIDDPAVLGGLYRRADLFAWPAVNEAYGMVLLEAQAMGCPVVAGGYGGVRDAMLPGRTGLMPEPGDAHAFADALAQLLDDPTRLAAYSYAASSFVRSERGIGGAARILRDALIPLCGFANAA